MPTYILPNGLVAPRATVSEEIGALRISIPAPRDYWTILFLLPWLAFWTIAGVQWWRNHSILLTAVWAFGEASAIYFFLYTLGRKDIILANSESLILSKKIFGVGWSRTYLVREVQNLRFQRGSGRRRPSRIRFDSGVKTISFAAYIGQDEALQLIGRICQKCALTGSGIRFAE